MCIYIYIHTYIHTYTYTYTVYIIYRPPPRSASSARWPRRRLGAKFYSIRTIPSYDILYDNILC